MHSIIGFYKISPSVRNEDDIPSRINVMAYAPESSLLTKSRDT